MDWQIIGIEDIDYVSKKTQKQVVGKKFHAYRDIDPKKGDGMEVECFYCSTAMSAYSLVNMGEMVKPVYNKYGVLEDLVLVNK